MEDDQQEIDNKINSPTRLSFKKWFLLSSGILLAAISIPLLFNSDNYTYNLNSEMASSMNEQDAWKNAKNLYDFTATDLDGKEVSMDKYKGNVLILVNVATYCGLTKANYAQLNDIYNTYKDKGLSIAGFPCNQFGNQEPGCSVDIKEFLVKNKVTWDVYDKVDVNGKSAHPLWKWLQNKKGGFLGIDAIKWNFTKFLIDREGNPVKRYAPQDEPKTFLKDIEAELAK